MSSLLLYHPPRTLPWEMLQHIFSHCDQSTLFAISLVSFACWELVGPILYESVEITNLDGLVSLFFFDSLIASNRLDPAKPLLTQIKTLSLAIQCSKLTRRPFFDLPDDPPEDEDLDDEEVYNGYWDFERKPERNLLDPHRLLASSSPLRINTLILVEWILPNFALQNFLPVQLFPHLSPRTLVLQSDTFQNLSSTHPDWCSMAAISFSPRFLKSWDVLERVVFAGMSVECWYWDSNESWKGDIPGIWGQIHEGGKLELVFDFASGGVDVRRERAPPSRALMMAVLDLGGLKKEFTSLVDLKVVVRVEKGRESTAKMQIARDLDEWMTPFVRVEVV